MGEGGGGVCWDANLLFLRLVFPPFSQVVLLLCVLVCGNEKSRVDVLFPQIQVGRGSLADWANKKLHQWRESFFVEKKTNYFFSFMRLFVAEVWKGIWSICNNGFLLAFETYFLPFFARVDMLILSFSQTITLKQVLGMSLAEGAR